jgi:predicted porin
MNMLKRGVLAVLISLACALPVSAADVGGSCCADLEERVKEMEATVATKGNRKVSVTISGQVSKSLLWIDGDDAVIGDNANSPSRVRVDGKAKVNADVEAGYVFEMNADALTLRHSFVYLKTAIGKVSLGHTSTATDGVSEVSLANTNVANLPSNIYGGIVDGPRRNLIRYDSPTIAGFYASASWASEDEWDAALRYASELGEFRLAGAVGYATDFGLERLSGSGSVMHVPSGVFLNGIYGRVDDADATAWHLTGGVERKLSEIGATTLFAEYGKLDVLGVSGDGFGLGIVQAVDAASMDLFAAYRDIDDVSVIHAGARIKF